MGGLQERNLERRLMDVAFNNIIRVWGWWEMREDGEDRESLHTCLLWATAQSYSRPLEYCTGKPETLSLLFKTNLDRCVHMCLYRYTHTKAKVSFHKITILYIKVICPWTAFCIKSRAPCWNFSLCPSISHIMPNPTNFAPLQNFCLSPIIHRFTASTASYRCDSKV